MKTKTVYIADDGKEFDTLEDCVNYETAEMSITNCGFMAGVNGVTKEIEEVDFVYFDEPAEMENFILVSDRLNLTTEGMPEEPSMGYYTWDYDSLMWYRLPGHLGDILYNYYRNK